MAEQKNNKSKYLWLSFKPVFRNKDISVRVKFLEELSNILDINAQDSGGLTMAHWGAYYGDMSVLKYCNEHKADFNIQDVARWTPIMLAVHENQENAVAYLLNNVKNIDLNKTNIDDKDVFQLANDSSTEQIKGMLYSYAKGKNSVAKQIKDANVNKK